MSKSKGNVVDPVEVIEKYGVDAFRYFLLREVPFGLDGDFSLAALEGRINSDLANDLGNLLSRSVTMITRYREGVVPEPDPSKDRGELEGKLKPMFAELAPVFSSHMEGLNFSGALTSVWAVVREMNGYVDKSAPWKEEDASTLSNVLYTLHEGLRIVALYVYPFMPASGVKIWESLGVAGDISKAEFDKVTVFGAGRSGAKVVKGPSLFPRIQKV